jgi:hypothetical protein
MASSLTEQAVAPAPQLEGRNSSSPLGRILVVEVAKPFLVEELKLAVRNPPKVKLIPGVHVGDSRGEG